jgi:hypothetical protein
VESVILVTAGDYDERFRARIPAAYKASEGAGGALVIEDGRSRIYIAKNDSLRNDLGPEKLDAVAVLGPTPSFYTVDFTDIAFCRDVLLAVADDPKVLVDNDHGVLLPGAEFVRVLRSQQDWDWRRDRP